MSLTRLLVDRKAVRGTFLRGTLHVASARDFVALRPIQRPFPLFQERSHLRECRLTLAGTQRVPYGSSDDPLTLYMTDGDRTRVGSLVAQRTGGELGVAREEVAEDRRGRRGF